MAIQDTLIRRMMATAALALALAGPGMAPAAAQSANREIAVAAQPLADAILDLSRQTGTTIFVNGDLVAGLSTSAVRGRMTVEAALDRLLAGTGLGYQRNDDGLYAIIRTPPAPPAGEGGGPAPDGPDVDMVMEQMVVTGTNIRGIAPVGSPSITLDREEIDATGFQTVEQLIRSLPQSFGGGGNPRSSRAANQGILENEAFSNNTFAAGVNLRGLSAGSTLVLLNGRRLAPTGTEAAFVDISMIPLSAVERVDILTDGASSIYGADAVAGVVNFVLRDDYQGAETGVSVGTVTEGSRQEYRVSQTLGTRWAGGSGLIAYEFFDGEALFTSEKAFAADAPDPFTLLPSERRHSVISTVRQQIGDVLTASLDGLYSRRASQGVFQLGRTTGTNFIFADDAVTEQIGVSPGVDVDVWGDWQVRVFGNYSRNEGRRESMARSTTEPDSVFEPRAPSSQVAEDWSADLVADGSVVSLPGGRVRAAVGGQYREETFEVLDRAGAVSNAKRAVTGAFAELYVPIVGPGNTLPAVERFEVNLSGRYDDYDDFGDTFNPKYGVLWSPLSGLNIRGSYATSFAVPRLGTQLDASGNFFAAPISLFDPSADGNLVLLQGTKPGLQPQGSKTFTVGADFSHSFAGGTLSIELTHYNIEFSDLIGSPPTSLFFDAALDPASVPFPVAVPSPSQALIDEGLVIGLRNGGIDGGGILDLTGLVRPDGTASAADFDLLIDLRVQNLSRVETRGLDFSIDYSRPTDLGTWSATLAGDYILAYDTQVIEGAAFVPEINRPFTPVDLRLRGRLGWAYQDLTASLFVNYTNSYIDDRFEPVVGVDAFTTVDVNLRYRVPVQSGVLSGIDVGLSVINLLGADPPRLQDDRTEGARSNTGYDATNADPLGRFISVQLTKRY